MKNALLSLFTLFVCLFVMAQGDKSRGLLQQEFITQNFIRPEFARSKGMKIESFKTIDSLFQVIQAAWLKTAPDTLRKHPMDVSVEDFNHIDAYCYFWTLLSITQQLDMPEKYLQYLVHNYMIPAMWKDYETLKQRPCLTSIQLIHSGTLGNTLAIGADNDADKGTVLACYRLYDSFNTIFRSLSSDADSAVSKYAKEQEQVLERFKYDLNAKTCFYNGETEKAYTYVLTGLSTDHYSKSRILWMSKKLLEDFALSGDKDKSFTLLNALFVNTSPDILNRDSLLSWYIKVDSLNGQKAYVNTLGKLSNSAFKKTGQTIKLPEKWNFIVNSVPPEKIKKIKYFFFDVWETYCMPCLAEFPDLNTFYEKCKNRDDVLFISINADRPIGGNNEDHVLQRCKEFNVKFPVVKDNAESALNDQLHVYGYPSKFIVNAAGEMMAKTDNSEVSTDAFDLLIKEISGKGK